MLTVNNSFGEIRDALHTLQDQDGPDLAQVFILNAKDVDNLMNCGKVIIIEVYGNPLILQFNGSWEHTENDFV